MITKEVIKALYKKYPKRVKSVDCLDMGLIFDGVAMIHDINIDIDTNRMSIGSIDSKSIFHSILLTHVHAFVPFEEWVAIVLNASIIFLNKKSDKVSIHLKPVAPSITDRIKSILSPEKE